MSDKPEPTNTTLWESIKNDIKARNGSKNWNAFYSGQLVQEYKRRGGLFSGKKTKGDLTRWYKEKWKDVGNDKYPVFRPTIKINSKTPLTVKEIEKTNLEQQISLKQKIKSSKLPPFQKRLNFV